MTDECGFSRRCGRGDDLSVLAAGPATATVGGWRMESRIGRGRAEMTCVALSIFDTSASLVSKWIWKEIAIFFISAPKSERKR